jgi:diketogulonate reductase-like aldo/keto reductase
LNFERIPRPADHHISTRWLVQQNISVVTAAEKHEYISEDLDLFSFELTSQEMATLAAI